MTPGRPTIRWNRSRCRPIASATMALITSPWLHARTTASGPCGVGRPRVGVPDRRDRPGRHRRHRLAAGERRRRRVRLDDLPQRLLGQRLQRSGRTSRRSRTRPAAARRPRRARAAPLDRLPAADQRAGDHEVSAPVRRRSAGRRPPPPGPGRRRPARSAGARPACRPRWTVVRPCRSRRTVATGPYECSRRARRRRSTDAGAIDRGARAERDAVPDEPDDRVVRDEPQQPGDRDVADDEAHRRARPASVSSRPCRRPRAGC